MTWRGILPSPAGSRSGGNTPADASALCPRPPRVGWGLGCWASHLLTRGCSCQAPSWPPQALTCPRGAALPQCPCDAWPAHLSPPHPTLPSPCPGWQRPGEDVCGERRPARRRAPPWGGKSEAWITGGCVCVCEVSCICTCACVHVGARCLFLYASVCVSVCVCKSLCVHLCGRVCVGMSVSVSVCVRVSVSARLCVRVSVSVRLCVRVSVWAVLALV